MFHNRKLNNHISRIHEKSLRIVYQDHNLQMLLMEIFKVTWKLAPETMTEVFDIIECPYPL